MRSVTIEVDTSGNPISEIYEFIARDVIESDELYDSIKYTVDESSLPNNESFSEDDLLIEENLDSGIISGGGGGTPFSLNR